jgi:hypothetical protein
MALKQSLLQPITSKVKQYGKYYALTEKHKSLVLLVNH